MPPSSPVIAIDGPAASGKGTIAKKLAKMFGFAHLDTGLLYRAVGVMVLLANKSPDDARAAARIARELTDTNLAKLKGDPVLRLDKASTAASKVATHPGVRKALLKFQRDFAAHPPKRKKGAVLDGRDIGTVIVPKARVKIYVTASTEARATRRFKELQKRSEKVAYKTVLAELKARDKRDETRTAAPAKPAKDAVILDTTNMNADEAFTAALAIVKKRMRAKA